MAHLRFPLPNGIPHEHDPLPNPHPEDDLFLDDGDGGFGVYLVELGISYEEYQKRRLIFYFCLSLLLSFCTVALYLFSEPDTIIQFPWVRSHLQDDVYHHPGRFALKYKDMEREFKVYAYFADDVLNKCYPWDYMSCRAGMEEIKNGTECEDDFFFFFFFFFFKNIKQSRFFTTDDPRNAHLFFVMPISFISLNSTSSLHKSCPMHQHQHQRTSQYSMQYPYRYWNQTQANQHFYVTAASSDDNAIRVVCKSKIASNEILLPPLHIPKRAYYEAELIFITKKDAMFCVCSGRSQITTACITKSILDGCIPVFLSTYNRLPFKRILDWDKFSLRIEKNDTYQLHNLVHRIKASNSFTLHSNLLKVQKSFKWNSPPSRFDAFHMAMFELWECYNQNFK